MLGISTLGRVLAGLGLGCAFALVAHAEQTRALTPVKPAANNERRTALVIGNGAYKTSPLRNPVNDARAMATALSETGFAVTLVEDAGRATMRRVIREWGDQLARGGVGLFYYAGHGMQIRGKNYLIPVTADVQREDEVEDESVDVNTVLSKMESAKNALNLLILDACRNNPFQRSFRSGAQGLAQMDAPTGTLISFATAPGSVAADGTGENGLYTHHLLRAIRTPGLPVEQLFKQVRIGVTKDTADKQVPWESSSLRGDFFFLALPPGMQAEEQRRQQQQQIEKAVGEAVKGSEDRAARERAEMQAAMEKVIQEALAKQRAQPEAERKGAAAAAPAPAPAPVARTDDRQIELAFWESIKGSTNPADFTAYLERYPQGAFAPLARNRVNQLTAVAETKAVTAPAPVAAAKPAPPPVQVASIAPAPTPAPVALGARWQYSGFGSDNRGIRFEHLVERQGSSAAGVLEVLRTKGGSAAPWVFTATPTLVGHSGGWTTFSPLVTGERIAAGMTWPEVSVERLERCNTGPVSCSARARVAGSEKVTVKAGTFDALKIVLEISMRGMQGGTSAREITYWYAPEAQRPVRYASRTLGGRMQTTDPNVEFELTAFQLDGGASGGRIDAAPAAVPSSGAAGPLFRSGHANLMLWYAPEVRRVLRMTGAANGPAALMSKFDLTLLAYMVR